MIHKVAVPNSRRPTASVTYSISAFWSSILCTCETCNFLHDYSASILFSKSKFNPVLWRNVVGRNDATYTGVANICQETERQRTLSCTPVPHLSHIHVYRRKDWLSFSSSSSSLIHCNSREQWSGRCVARKRSPLGWALLISASKHQESASTRSILRRKQCPCVDIAYLHPRHSTRSTSRRGHPDRRRTRRPWKLKMKGTKKSGEVPVKAIFWSKQNKISSLQRRQRPRTFRMLGKC